jgi:hypothetical protein
MSEDSGLQGSMHHDHCSALDGLIRESHSLVLSQKQNEPRSAALSLVTVLPIPLEGPSLPGSSESCASRSSTPLVLFFN